MFLVLIWSTSQGCKAESALEPPNDFEHDPPGLKSSAYIYMTEPLIFTKSWQTKTKTNTVSNKAMVVTQIQSICIIHICGGCHPEGFC